MKKNVAILALSVLALLGNATVAQQKKSDQPAPMRRTGPSSEQAKLSFLVGTYATETKVHLGPTSSKDALGKGTSAIRWGLDSMVIFVEEQSVNPVLGNYKGFGILGYDRSASQYALSMYNNFGDHPQYRGAFSGDTLVLSCRVPSPGGAFDQKILWYKDGATLRLQVLNDMGTGFVPVVDQFSMPVESPGKSPRDN
ncbi:MAG TPA: DUF1579 family protein [Bacteroidota bacterium]|nr:DUF1579 family protein [Bacteroidota bacterium]